MRWVSQPTSLFLALSVGIGIGVISTPIWKRVIMIAVQSSYSDLTFRCDSAMRGHLLAKQKLVGLPTEENVQNLKSAEIGLIDCQDYDLMRKKLIRWGISENELSEMALLAIEEKGEDLRDVIRTHELSY